MSMYSLTIVTPEGQLFDEQVRSVKAPASSGYLGILAHHAPMVCTLTAGVVTVKSGEREATYFAVSGGVLEVNKDGVVILADTAQEADTVKAAKELVSRAAAKTT